MKNYSIFIENTEKLIRAKRKSLLRQDTDLIKNNYPQMYSELIRYYKIIFGIKLNLKGCANDFIDAFFKLKSLKPEQIMERIAVKSKIKENFVAYIDGNYYSNQSPNLTNTICKQIYQKYGMLAFEHYEEGSDVIEIEKQAKTMTIQDVSEHFENMEGFEARENINLQETMTISELRQFAKDNNLTITKRKKIEIIEELKSQL